MTQLSIRAAIVKDVSPIVEIRLAALSSGEIRGFSTPEFTATYTSTEKLRKTQSRENRLKDGVEVFVAEDEGNMVGFIVFKTESNYGCIDNIVVSKEEQGKRIGSAFVTYVEGIAKSEGCYLMKTDASKNADGVPWKAYSFQIRMSYEDTRERLLTNYDFKEIPLIKNLKQAINQVRKAEIPLLNDFLRQFNLSEINPE